MGKMLSVKSILYAKVLSADNTFRVKSHFFKSGWFLKNSYICGQDIFNVNQLEFYF